ncbi:Tim44/TimA family putative adaptor protein [Aureimonas leprariae]|uniref:Tim44 domain-containing protein n=1 Tax=Plantimonas leprariae TaxID=2615207 RepID=A0A7V7TWB5_9HYPH|nr:Tim44/TimA family putative adaptor protein [Aureimonas leprariae]KAB0679336.1 Tim44 domain-containing protein [Aureimonas leprariae]
MSFGTIVIIVVALIVLYQLRSVLGRRTGNERPPFDPYARPEKVETKSAQAPAARNGEGGKVIALPGRREPVVVDAVAEDRYAVIDKVVPPGEPANADLRRIRDADRTFDPAEFLQGMQVAYEMVLTAFADGDRKTLKNLLSQEAYAGFEQAITEREKLGQTMKSAFVGINEATIVSGAVKDREVLLTVRIVSQLISSVTDRSGAVIDGDPEAVVEVRDLWTFARDIRSRDPNWKVVETQSADA